MFFELWVLLQLFCDLKYFVLIHLRFYFSIHSPYIYGSPYLNAAAAATSTAAGLVPIQTSQLTQAAALAAATNQFYEYQVSIHKHYELAYTNLKDHTN